MTSSGTSTEHVGRRPDDAGFRAWHFYILFAMVGATAAVVLARNTHPAALLLLSAAVVSAGLVGYTVHRALQGFLAEGREEQVPLDRRTREGLERDKALVLRSLKELEFDHRMGKIDDADFRDVEQRLRARALALMEALDHPDPGARPAAAPPASVPPAPPVCEACETVNDTDARFCKACGQSL